MNGYELSRYWFDWCFENPEKISPNHTALYFFCIEHCNRMGWKEKFGLPTSVAKEAIGIKSYNTYINTLNDLVDFGFIILIEKSKNQYSSNIVALSKNNKALNKALDKATVKHLTKQVESTGESIYSIDKQETIKPINNRTNSPEGESSVDFKSLTDYWNLSFKNKSIPKIEKMDTKRKKAVNTIVKEFGKEKIKEAVSMILNNEFFNGGSENGWVLTFDWLFKTGNFTKVIEGNYNRNKTTINNNAIY